MSARSLAAVAAVALAGLSVAPTAQAAPTAMPVTFTAFTTFEEPPLPDDFEASIPGCESGTVQEVDGGPRFTPWGGVFVGTKSFSCGTDGQSGFDVRLRARFSDAGATGTWTVVGGWGDLEGLKGSGSLVGIITDTGIDDVYTGTFR